MKRNKFLISLLAILTPIQMLVAQNEIPTGFMYELTDSENAYKFAKECVPTINEKTFQRYIEDGFSVVENKMNNRKPYAVITKEKIYCINKSQTLNPILPLNAFNGTIGFQGMKEDDVVKLRTDLSQQLSETGYATALVIFDDGNAYAIAYLFASDLPYKFFYHATYLKKGEFDEKKFNSVYRGGEKNTIGILGRTYETKSSEHKVEYTRVFLD